MASLGCCLPGSWRDQRRDVAAAPLSGRRACGNASNLTFDNWTVSEAIASSTDYCVL
jgi:hypothetical protein